MRTVMSVVMIAAIAFLSYVAGTKAGRGKYREIKATASAIWNDPQIKKARRKALKESRRLGF